MKCAYCEEEIIGKIAYYQGKIVHTKCFGKYKYAKQHKRKKKRKSKRDFWLDELAERSKNNSHSQEPIKFKQKQPSNRFSKE